MWKIQHTGKLGHWWHILKENRCGRDEGQQCGTSIARWRAGELEREIGSVAMPQSNRAVAKHRWGELTWKRNRSAMQQKTGVWNTEKGRTRRSRLLKIVLPWSSIHCPNGGLQDCQMTCETSEAEHVHDRVYAPVSVLRHFDEKQHDTCTIIAKKDSAKRVLTQRSRNYAFKSHSWRERLERPHIE